MTSAIGLPVATATGEARERERSESVSTVVLVAVVMAYADTFWLVSLREAVGVTGQVQRPFLSWMIRAAVLLPLFVLVVKGTLVLARRRFGMNLTRPSAVVAASLLLALSGAVLATGVAAVDGIRDYRVQATNLQDGHHEDLVASNSRTGAVTLQHGAVGCNAGCEALLSQNRGVHVRAVRDISGLLLVTNVVLVGWAVALRGGQLLEESD